MTVPRHLWSGDWRRESEDAARRTAGRHPGAPAAAPPAPEIPVREPNRGGRDRSAATRRLLQTPPSQSGPARPPEPRRTARDRWDEARRRLRTPPSKSGPGRRPVALTLVTVGVLAALLAYGATKLLRDQSAGDPPAVLTPAPSPSTGGGSASAGAPWLGVHVTGLPTGGAVVAEVVPGSPADSAGLHPGDVIASIDSQNVNGVSDITAALVSLHPGSRAQIGIYRGGQAQLVIVTLAARPAGVTP